MSETIEKLHQHPAEPKFMPDGWDRSIRLGVVAPHADVGPEAELSALSGNQVTVHGARLYFSAMRVRGEMDETIPHDPVAAFAKPPHVDELVASLSEAPLDAIALAFTSSAFKHGPDGERALVERLALKANGIPLTTTALAATAALEVLEARRIALIAPPWFDYALSQSGADYFVAQGFTIVDYAPAGLRSGQRYITPVGLYDWIGTVVERSGADTVFVAGNGQRAVGVIDAAERSFGTTVLTANQVIYWHALSLAGSTPRCTGYGRLLS